MDYPTGHGTSAVHPDGIPERDVVNDVPTTPGFYKNVKKASDTSGFPGPSQAMIYSLDPDGQWRAFSFTGMVTKCVWGYIEQTLDAFDLERIT